jgi:hypothetical protein
MRRAQAPLNAAKPILPHSRAVQTEKACRQKGCEMWAAPMKVLDVERVVNVIQQQAAPPYCGSAGRAAGLEYY